MTNSLDLLNKIQVVENLGIVPQKLDLATHHSIIGLPLAVCQCNESNISLSWGLHEKVRQTGIIYLPHIVYLSWLSPIMYTINFSLVVFIHKIITSSFQELTC